VELTTHLHLVRRSRMRGAIPPLPQYAFMAWSLVKAQGQLYLYLYLSIYLFIYIHFLRKKLLGKKELIDVIEMRMNL